MSSPLPGGRHRVPRAPSPPARPPLALPRLRCGIICATHPARAPVSQGPPGRRGMTILALPHGAGWRQGRRGAGEGSGPGVGMGVTLSLQSRRGRGPGPEGIARQGLRRAAAARSPLAFRGTAAAQGESHPRKHKERR